MTQDELDTMTEAYITCALFTADEEIIPPKSGEFDSSPYLPRVTKSTWAKAKDVCAQFYAENSTDLASYPADSAGHDLWYTRNGHGVGFWEADHCTDDEGERLSESARKLGEAYLFKQNGWFYVE